MPEITQEMLQEQMAALQGQRNSVDGAIQLCQHLLFELDKTEENEQEQDDNGSNMDIAKETSATNGQDGKGDNVDSDAAGDDTTTVGKTLAAASRKAKSVQTKSES